MKLPEYVINCFLAAGYDSADTIASMEVSGPRNSIEVIEEFIDKHFRGNGAYYNNSLLAKHPFVFPPGHKVRIASFIAEVKNAIKPSTKPKREVSCQRQPKRPRVASHTSEDEAEPSSMAIVGQVRGSISRWVKSQSNDKLQNIKENEHFEVVVSKGSNGPTVSVKCNACSKTFGLHKKNSTAAKYQISNWTRHIKACKMLMKTERCVQKPLGMFISVGKSVPNGSTSDSLVTSDSSGKTSSSEFSDNIMTDTTIKSDQPVASMTQQVFQKAPPLNPVQ